MTANIPWQKRPANSKEVMWRYDSNPIIGRYAIPSSNSVFNSAVVPFEDGYAGVFRCDNKAVQMNIFAGFSKNGIDWDIEHEPIEFKAGNTEMLESDYKYDPGSPLSKIDTGSPGAMATMVPPSGSPTLSISRSSSNVRMLFCLSIAMGCCFQRRSTENMPC